MQICFNNLFIKIFNTVQVLLSDGLLKIEQHKIYQSYLNVVEYHKEYCKNIIL